MGSLTALCILFYLFQGITYMYLIVALRHGKINAATLTECFVFVFFNAF